LLLSLQTRAFAENVTAIRSVYVGEEKLVMESDALIEDVLKSHDSYLGLLEDHQKDQFNKKKKLYTVDQLWSMQRKLESEITSLTDELNSTYEELTQAVEREMAIIDITEIEVRYEVLRDNLSSKILSFNSLTNYLLDYDKTVYVEPTVTEQELLDNYNIMKQLQADYAIAKEYEDVGDVTGLVAPLSIGELNKTSPFEMRPNPFGGPGYEFHNGVDLSSPYGSQALALFSGTVVVSDFSATYGNYVIIDHGHGVKTMYGHASKNLVEVGEFVKQYQIIQDIGSTGRSTGPHLHLALSIDGEYVDPYILF
jgi:murein DD-endopeptidase MepM/ murein hydrolase activator NlpD